jgi:putative nucleotidyltransferase with HDIG domain
MVRSLHKMNIPSRKESERFIDRAADANNGPWIQHSKNVATAARLIAENHPSLDPETAHIFGLLHDIGRQIGRTHLRHVTDGYHFLADQGFHDAARICLTHSFPIPDLDVFVGEHDCNTEDLTFLKEFLTTVEYDEYDRLIQICDGIAPASGFCLLEKRMVDVGIRRGITDLTIQGWEARFRTIEEFEEVIGQSIYEFLPGIIEGTFGNGLYLK